MSGKTTLFGTDLLQAIFNATFSGAAVTTLFQNAGSPATNIYISLHTADPGVGGNQTTNETSYTSYARATVARTSGGFTISNNTVVPAANIVFAQCTGSTSTITNWGVGLSASSTGTLLYSGTVVPNISVATGVTPTLTTGSTIVES